MSEVNSTVEQIKELQAANPDVVPGEVVKEVTAGKEAVFSVIIDIIKDRTGKRISRKDAKDIFMEIIERIMLETKRDGELRLPGGLGAFYKKTTRPTKRRSPKTQEVVNVPSKDIIRYKMGINVMKIQEVLITEDPV